MAKDVRALRALRVTHVVNVAFGPEPEPAPGMICIDTSQAYYDAQTITPGAIKFLGVEAQDHPAYDLAAHFARCNAFIHDALCENERELSKNDQSM